MKLERVNVLIDAMVCEIRRLHAEGWTQIVLAGHFGVSKGHMSHILAGRRREKAVCK